MSDAVAELDLAVAPDRALERPVQVGLDRTAMETLGVGPGEYVAVSGRTTTVASVVRADVPADAIALGTAVRDDAGAARGDRVTVSRAAVRAADRVTLAPERPVSIREGEVPLSGPLAGWPVTPGDAVRADLLDGAVSLSFSVVDAVPSEPVVITDQTTVIVRDAPESRGSADRPSLDDVGGHDAAIEAVRDAIVAPLEAPDRFERFGRTAIGGVLLSGPAGVGKSRLARAVANDVDAHAIWLDGADVIGERADALATHLEGIRREARDRAPTLLVLDDLDQMAPASDRSDRSRRVEAHLRSLLSDLGSEPGIAILGTARDREDVAASLRDGGRFERVLDLPVPDPADRLAVLEVLTRPVPLAEDVDLEAAASRTNGFVGADLEALVSEAVLSAARRDAAVVTAGDLDAALSVAEPSALRDHAVDVPDVTEDDIGGLEDAKRALARSVEWPMRYPDLFEALDADPPRGILLYGPPGTGKTMLAKAVANATDATFLSVKGPEILDKWVGESERAVRDVFATARRHAPSVVFLDEVDAISPRRGGDAGTRVVERVVSQLLTEMDGLEPLDDVVVLGATNRPDVIDPALLRAGRFEHHVEVGPPDRAARREIFAVHTRSIPTEGLDLDAIARETEGYTGSDVAAVVREASLLAAESVIEGERSDPVVTAAHVASALASVSPSIPNATRRERNSKER